MTHPQPHSGGRPGISISASTPPPEPPSLLLPARPSAPGATPLLCRPIDAPPARASRDRNWEFADVRDCREELPTDMRVRAEGVSSGTGCIMVSS